MGVTNISSCHFNCCNFSKTFACLVASRAVWMRPQITGASRWSGWRLKTSSCHSRCRGPWLLRRRQLVRPEQRSGSQEMCTAEHQQKSMCRHKRHRASCLQVIAAEGEMNASRALKEASLVIAESPSALQLRYLQTLNTIAAERNSTIVFPLPMELMSHFMRN